MKKHNFIFRGKWITHPEYDGGKNFYFEAKKQFEITVAEKRNAPHLLYITADSAYCLKINGVEIGTGPVRGTVKLQFYDVYDIGRFLHRGRNEVRVIVYCLGEENFTTNSQSSGLLMELPGIFCSGRDFLVRYADEWRRDVPYFSIQTGFMEYCDLAKAERNEAGAKWVEAAEVADRKVLRKHLLERPVPFLSGNTCYPAEVKISAVSPRTGADDPMTLPEVLEKQKHFALSGDRLDGLMNLCGAGGCCTINRAADGKGINLIFDFREEIVGRFFVDIDAEEGTAASLTYGEYVKNDHVKSMYDQHKNYHFTDHYILRKGHNEIGTHIFERGFRYVQLSLNNFSGPLVLQNVRGVERRYPFSRRGSFFCDDHLLNAIYAHCVRTLESCTTDIFIDCPWRERGFWVNDMIVENITTLNVFGSSQVHKHAFELAFSQATPSGLLPGICPMPKLADELSFIFPATNLFMVQMLKDYLNFSGDVRTVRHHLPAIEKILDGIWALGGEVDGILSASTEASEWNFYDWGFEENDYSFNGCRESMLNFLFLFACRRFEALAAELNYRYDEAELKRRIDIISSHVLPKFFDAERGVLVDEVLYKGQKSTLSSQLAHAFALLSGELPEKYREKFLNNMIDGELLAPEFYLHIFLFRAAREGGKKYSAEFLKRIRKYWGRCIINGATTVPEAGVHKTGVSAMGADGASLCHGFSTSPIYFFNACILGVEPLKSNFSEFSFSPELFDLKSAAGAVPTPHGNIEVELKTRRGGRKIVAEIKIPNGCTAILPNNNRLSAGHHKIEIGGENE